MLIKSYGKINPILKIGNKRDDGFHNLFLMYQTISIFDEIDISCRNSTVNKIIITCTDKHIPTDCSNLAYKAASLVLKNISRKFEVSVHIEKNIPAGGGLGGGSSNAATVIKGLNSLLNLNMTKGQMMAIASEIGSDVPFFVEGGTATGVRRGEIIIPMKPLPQFHFLAVFPQIPFPTGKMYSLIDRKDNSIEDIYFQITDVYKNTIAIFENDFDNIVKDMSTKIYDLMEDIRKLGFKVMLSGSGSTFLVFGEENSDYSKVISILPKDYKYTKGISGVFKD